MKADFEASREMSERGLAAAIERSASPVALLDDDGIFTGANEALLAIHGRDRSELIGSRFDAFIEPTMRDRAADEFETLIRDGRIISTVSPVDQAGRSFELTRVGVSNIIPGTHLLVSLERLGRSEMAGRGPDAGIEKDADALSVLIVGPDPLVIDFVKSLIAASPRIGAVASCDALERLEPVVRGHRPDLIITASSPFTPSVSSVNVADDQLVDAANRALAVISDLGQETPVLAVDHRERSDVVEALLNLGLAGVVGPRDSAADLMVAIDRVVGGGVYLNPSTAAAIARVDKEGFGALTAREREVLTCLALGYTNSECAKELFISTRTVESHRASINETMGFSSRRELVAFALEHCLIGA